MSEKPVRQAILEAVQQHRPKPTELLRLLSESYQDIQNELVCMIEEQVIVLGSDRHLREAAPPQPSAPPGTMFSAAQGKRIPVDSAPSASAEPSEPKGDYVGIGRNGPTPRKEVVHKYAGWPGKAVCGVVGAVTTIKTDDVTCERCLPAGQEREEAERAEFKKWVRENHPALLVDSSDRPALAEHYWLAGRAALQQENAELRAIIEKEISKDVERASYKAFMQSEVGKPNDHDIASAAHKWAWDIGRAALRASQVITPISLQTCEVCGEEIKPNTLHGRGYCVDSEG